MVIFTEFYYNERIFCFLPDAPPGNGYNVHDIRLISILIFFFRFVVQHVDNNLPFDSAGLLLRSVPYFIVLNIHNSNFPDGKMFNNNIIHCQLCSIKIAYFPLIAQQI